MRQTANIALSNMASAKSNFSFEFSCSNSRRRGSIRTALATRHDI